jgi:hypothetical protein
LARNLCGRVLGTQVIGDLAFANGPRALLSGTLSLDRLNLAQPELQGLRTDEARDAGAAARPAAHVSSWRGRFESDLSLRIATIVGLPMTARDVAARVQWCDGVVGLQGVAATLADIPVPGEGTLRAAVAHGTQCCRWPRCAARMPTCVSNWARSQGHRCR